MKMMDNHQVLVENSQHNANNMETMSKHLGIIVKNQEIIVNNQSSIINNQKQIVANQITLNVLQKSLTHILNHLRNQGNESESMEQTLSFIDVLRSQALQEFNSDKLIEPKSLS